MVKKKDSGPRCSFCGADANQAAKLIAGPAVHICDRCVDLCNRILAGEPPTSFGSADTDDALLTALRATGAAVDSLSALLHERVGALRGRGISWQAIADALGTSRQSAWERFSGRNP